MRSVRAALVILAITGPLPPGVDSAIAQDRKTTTHPRPIEIRPCIHIRIDQDGMVMVRIQATDSKFARRPKSIDPKTLSGPATLTEFLDALKNARVKWRIQDDGNDDTSRAEPSRTSRLRSAWAKGTVVMSAQGNAPWKWCDWVARMCTELGLRDFWIGVRSVDSETKRRRESWVHAPLCRRSGIAKLLDLYSRFDDGERIPSWGTVIEVGTSRSGRSLTVNRRAVSKDGLAKLAGETKKGDASREGVAIVSVQPEENVTVSEMYETLQAVYGLRNAEIVWLRRVLPPHHVRSMKPLPK